MSSVQVIEKWVFDGCPKLEVVVDKSSYADYYMLKNYKNTRRKYSGDAIIGFKKLANKLKVAMEY